MRVRITRWLVFFLLALPEVVLGQGVIEGTLLGENGQPMAAAHVSVSANLRSRLGRGRQLITVDEAGQYRVEVPYEGPVHLRFFGAYHTPQSVALLLDESPEVALDVRLSRRWLDPDQSFTRVVTADHDYAYEAGVPLTESEQGGYEAWLQGTGEPIVYEVQGATTEVFEGYLLTSISADSLIFNGRDRYLFWANPLHLQDSLLVRVYAEAGVDPQPPDIRFGDGNAREAAFWEFYQSMFLGGWGRRYPDEARPDPPKSQAEAIARYRAYVADLEDRIEDAADPFARQLLLMRYLLATNPFNPFRVSERYTLRGERPMGLDVSPVRIDRVLQEIPPDAWVWVLQPELPRALLYHTEMSPTAVAYVREMAAVHPSNAQRWAARHALFLAFYSRAGLTDTTQAMGTPLADSLDQPEARNLIKAILNPRPLRAGRRAVRMPGLGGPSEGPFVTDSLAGKVLLLDFRTADCAGCPAEPHALDTLQATYAAQGLVTVTVLLGPSASVAAPVDTTVDGRSVYRPSAGFLDPMVMGLGIRTTPNRVLIDRDRVIVGVGATLYGDRLAATLARVFQSNN